MECKFSKKKARSEKAQLKLPKFYSSTARETITPVPGIG